jgi:hypothetical protein
LVQEALQQHPVETPGLTVRHLVRRLFPPKVVAVAGMPRQPLMLEVKVSQVLVAQVSAASEM